MTKSGKTGPEVLTNLNYKTRSFVTESIYIPTQQVYTKTQNKFKLGYLLLKTCLLHSHSQNTVASKEDRRSKFFYNINKNLF